MWRRLHKRRLRLCPAVGLGSQAVNQQRALQLFGRGGLQVNHYLAHLREAPLRKVLLVLARQLLRRSMPPRRRRLKALKRPKSLPLFRAQKVPPMPLFP